MSLAIIVPVVVVGVVLVTGAALYLLNLLN
jgi:hypothetical protein